MTSVLMSTFFMMCVVCETVSSLPCLTIKSKEDFIKARKALTNLEDFLKSQASVIKSKVQALDTDLTSMETDFKNEGRQWTKYNSHCYYIGDDDVRWTDAERKCREIGGYLAKIDDSSENSWIQQQVNNASIKNYHWLGSTDVVNGDWRWIYDQTQMSYKHFASGRPYPTSNANSHSYNCIMMNYSNGYWDDYPCQNNFPYVCESNFCLLYVHWKCARYLVHAQIRRAFGNFGFMINFGGGYGPINASSTVSIWNWLPIEM